MKGYGDGCRNMVVWSPLEAGENGFIDLVSHGRIFDKASSCHHEECAAGAAECFVCSGHEDICKRGGTGVYAADDKPRDVRNVCEKVGTHAIADFSPRFPIKDPRVGSGSYHDHGWFFFFGKGSDILQINEAMFIDIILDGPVKRAGKRDVRVAVREMSPAGEFEPHDRISGF